MHYDDQAASGRVVWLHQVLADDLFITSPLGQGIARLTRRNNEFELVTGDQRKYRAEDAETLTQQVLGWALPLAGLPEWVQGHAQPGRPAEILRDASGQATELRQDRWHIQYLEYERNRPTKLRLARDDMEIRLVVDDWQVAP